VNVPAAATTTALANAPATIEIASLVASEPNVTPRRARFGSSATISSSTSIPATMTKEITVARAPFRRAFFAP